jgi:cell wall-associated NlpC family hydrolase
MRTNGWRRLAAGLMALAAGAAFSSGCRTRAKAVPPRSPALEAPFRPAHPGSARAPLAHMGYTIQVGAFAVIENAIALANTLTAAGLDAFYFPSGSGLFKVRFGNFPSREAALAEAGKLKDQGRIGAFFIVGPADYAVTRPSLKKPPFDITPPPNAVLRERLVETARSFIGVEYAWGGTSVRSGFDCSGLVRAIYQLNGLAMPRTVGDQYQAGSPVPADNLRKGDLVFFTAAPGGPLSHVGIYIGDGVFIHAPGSGKYVRRENLDGAWFKTHLAGCRTYLSEGSSSR